MKQKICSNCTVTFSCGPDDQNNACWCNDLPAIMPLNFEGDCFCPDCLKKIVEEKLKEENENIS